MGTGERGRSAGPAAPAGADAPVLLSVGGEQVEVRRSARRTRTVSAFREGDRVVVLLPARLTRAQERDWVERMLTRLVTSEGRKRPTDERLAERARDLSRRYFDGRAVPTAVSWSRTAEHRWGSCTPMHGTIRIAERARDLPGWVVDYILVHELAHLLEPSHSQHFWDLVAAYPRAERARGWLEGYDVGSRAVPGGESPWGVD